MTNRILKLFQVAAGSTMEILKTNQANTNPVAAFLASVSLSRATKQGKEEPGYQRGSGRKVDPHPQEVWEAGSSELYLSRQMSLKI